jgi:hypothetical protein
MIKNLSSSQGKPRKKRLSRRKKEERKSKSVSVSKRLSGVQARSCINSKSLGAKMCSAQLQ